MKIRLTVFLASLALVLSCTPSHPAPAVQPLPPPSGVVDAYRAWVETQADTLIVQTNAFVEAYLAGDREKAKALYAPARMFLERIEPVAESLGDLDAKLDAREGDVPSEQWGGFHYLEKLLWSTAELGQGKPAALALASDVKRLRAKLETAELSVPLMVTGSVELLNEISTSKVTGEEERYSHTDLWDFQANLEGAEAIWTLLSPSVSTRDPELARKIDARFSSLHGLLEVHRKGDGFRPYPEVYAKEVKALAAAVDALAEPLAAVGGVFGAPAK